jgi:eukaryotic-like serine/threonine-protein kinase
VRRAFAVLTVVLAGCSGSGDDSAAPSTVTTVESSTTTESTAPPTTEVRIYSAWTDTVRRLTPQPGECFAGSNKILRSDAWRCTIGNVLHDPCFSDPLGGSAVVACKKSPFSDDVTVIKAPSLPVDSANPSEGTNSLPWAVKLADGKECIFLSGAGVVVADLRDNYSCNGQLELYGDPERRTGQRWRIFSAPAGSTELKHTEIAIAWF